MTATSEARAARKPVPIANPGIVEAELRRVRKRADRGVLVLRAAAEWGGPDTTDVDGVNSTVRPCETVLGVLDAITTYAGEGYLVVLTPCDEHELGTSVLARVIGNKIHAINRWDLAREAFGAHLLEHRLTTSQYRWVVDALLEARPPDGWPKARGPVLDLGTALSALINARLGLGATPDAASLLEWSREPAAVARFSTLSIDEQRGIAEWLRETTGHATDVLFRLVEGGHATDALPFGLIAGVVFADSRQTAVLTAQGRAEQRFFGSEGPARQALLDFAEAAESVVLRWQEAKPDHATSVLERAEEILAEMHCVDLAEASPLLETGFAARSAEFSTEVARVLPAPRLGDLEPVEQALARLTAHRLASRHQLRVVGAKMTARLLRWLAVDHRNTTTLAELVNAHIRDGGWVDRAYAAVWAQREAVDAYARLLFEVQARRDKLDKAFADRLAAWSETSGRTEELVLAENLMERIARPVAAKSAPLIIVLDGMSTAVACGLAEGISRRWLEVGRHADGREGALATVPSVTEFSRASLLSGRLVRGQRPQEERGFAEFWGKGKSALFEKSDFAAGVSDEVTATIGQRNLVVGVVLNAVDDALDHGRESGRPDWSPTDIAGLTKLLDSAWSAGRPVVLTSDHGHVLDRGEVVLTERGEHARYRTGTPEGSEVEIRGPRVLTENNRVVVPWNERIRYTARQGGYHGGVSLAEMVIPILVFVPSKRQIPDGWEDYTEFVHEPAWWAAVPAPEAEMPAPVKPRKPKKAARARPPEEVPLFEAVEAIPQPLGAEIVGSELFISLTGQQGRTRVPVATEQVSALIDALAARGGKLPLAAAAKEVGQLPIRMRGYVAHVAKLLNFDGYQVIRIIDGGRTVELDLDLLCEQFLSRSR